MELKKLYLENFKMKFLIISLIIFIFVFENNETKANTLFNSLNLAYQIIPN